MRIGVDIPVRSEVLSLILTLIGVRLCDLASYYIRVSRSEDRLNPALAGEERSVLGRLEVVFVLVVVVVIVIIVANVIIRCGRNERRIRVDVAVRAAVAMSVMARLGEGDGGGDRVSSS